MESNSYQQLKAAVYLQGILPLMEDLVQFDPESAAAVTGRRRVIQFEVRDGPAAHLMIDSGAIRHGCGKHPFPDVRLTFKSPDRLNRMFAGENVRPGIRRGFSHLLFLSRRFPVLAERLDFYLQGEGKSSQDETARRFLLRMGLRAMLGGMAAVAEFDPDLSRVAEAAPFGTLLVKILPDGPYGTFGKIRHNSGYRFVADFERPIAHPNAVMAFSTPETAQKVIDGQLNAVTAIGAGKDIAISGLLPLIDKAGIFLYRLGRLTQEMSG